MSQHTNPVNATDTQESKPRRPRRWRRTLIIVAAVLTVLTLPRVLAHGAFNEAKSAWNQGRMDAMASQLLLRHPLGTEITVEFFDEDPSTGASATATLEATVGETSESAFDTQVREAMIDSTHLRISLSERTERFTLPTNVDGAMPGRGLLMGAPLGNLGEGDTITVALFASDEASNPSTTLTFTQGVDSLAAFQDALVNAIDDATVAEVTLPAQVRVQALDEAPIRGRLGLADRMHQTRPNQGAMMRPQGSMSHGQEGRSGIMQRRAMGMHGQPSNGQDGTMGRPTMQRRN